MHVDAVHRGFVRTRLPIDLDGRRPSTEKNFTLTRGVSISGKFVDRNGKPWEIAESHGEVRVGTDLTNRSYSGLINKHRPKDAKSDSRFFLADGDGPYHDEQMLFPTTSSFLIQGVLPGRTTITFAPQKVGQKVAEIRYDGRDILKSGIDTKPGEELRDVTILIETP